MGEPDSSEPSASAPSPPEHHLGFGESLAYALGKFALGVVPAPVMALLVYFWAQEDEGKPVVFTSLGIFAAMQLIGRLQDAVSDPIVGHLSDRHTTRFGRRMASSMRWASSVPRTSLQSGCDSGASMRPS